MKSYLITLLEEKQIDLETDMNIEGQINFTLENVIEFITNLPKTIQNKIKTTLVQIDFQNGDVMHYFKYIAEGMVKSL